MTSGSYGQAFNEGRGGVFATWLDSNALRIYWWSRDKVPSDITSGNPDPSTWGTPASQFVSGSGCNVDNYFKKQTIVGLVLAEPSFLLFVGSSDRLSRLSTRLSAETTSISPSGKTAAGVQLVFVLAMSTLPITQRHLRNLIGS